MISVFVALRHQRPGGTGGCHDNPLCCVARYVVFMEASNTTARDDDTCFLYSRSVTFTNYILRRWQFVLTCALPCPGEGNPLHAGRMISPNSSQLPRASSQEELVISNFAFRRLCRNPHHKEVSVHTPYPGDPFSRPLPALVHAFTSVHCPSCRSSGCLEARRWFNCYCVLCNCSWRAGGKIFNSKHTRYLMFVVSAYLWSPPSRV